MSLTCHVLSPSVSKAVADEVVKSLIEVMSKALKEGKKGAWVVGRLVLTPIVQNAHKLSY
jgi:hypothetical protein